MMDVIAGKTRPDAAGQTMISRLSRRRWPAGIGRKFKR
jgi:ABC-type uncharacterized transport system ATPase subunit